MKLFDLLKVHVRGTSSLRIILISVVLHSAASILLIYLHLRSFFQNELSHYEPEDLLSREGGIEFASRRQQLNLLSSREIDSSDLWFGYRGWWADRGKWNSEIVCFPHRKKWGLCSKVFTTKCKSDFMWSIYQFVPIRRGFLLQDLVISLRARTENLILEQANHAADPLLGIHVLVRNSDNISESIRRSVRYSSPPGTHVTALTVMLSCFGYSGIASFTDIEITPGAESNNEISADAIVASCSTDASVTQTEAVNRFRQYRHVSWSQSDALGKDCTSSRLVNRITLGVHISMDRISVLERSLQNWNGIISLSIFVPVENLTEGLSEWQRLYLDKKIKSLSISDCSRVTLVMAESRGQEFTDYPINHLYNSVIRNVFSQFVLLIDGDFQVSPGLEAKFQESVDLNSASRKAFVVPAFEWIESVQARVVTVLRHVLIHLSAKQKDAIRGKDELIQLIFREDPLVQPLQSYDAPESHKLTNYFKWYFNGDSYRVYGFSDKYEPFVVMETAAVSPFNEQFSSHSGNRISRAAHTSEMFADGFSFFVLANAWMIRHPPNSKRSDLTSPIPCDPYSQLRNVQLRFQSHVNLFRRLSQKYNLSESHCIKT